jgi:hypothetical protein
MVCVHARPATPRDALQELELVLDKNEIKRRYVKSWFWLDLFASIPYDIIEYSLVGFNSDGGGQLGMLGLLKLPRLLRLGKVCSSTPDRTHRPAARACEERVSKSDRIRRYRPAARVRGERGRIALAWWI